MCALILLFVTSVWAPQDKICTFDFWGLGIFFNGGKPLPFKAPAMHIQHTYICSVYQFICSVGSVCCQGVLSLAISYHGLASNLGHPIIDNCGMTCGHQFTILFHCVRLLPQHCKLPLPCSLNEAILEHIWTWGRGNLMLTVLPPVYIWILPGFPTLSLFTGKTQCPATMNGTNSTQPSNGELIINECICILLPYHGQPYGKSCNEGVM